ncbi:hypothetical protein GN956_G19461 [Arapaima gigas]
MIQICEMLILLMICRFYPNPDSFVEVANQKVACHLLTANNDYSQGQHNDGIKPDTFIPERESWLCCSLAEGISSHHHQASTPLAEAQMDDKPPSQPLTTLWSESLDA